MVLVGQHDHLAGGAVLDVAQELADRVDLRFVKLTQNANTIYVLIRIQSIILIYPN